MTRSATKTSIAVLTTLGAPGQKDKKPNLLQRFNPTPLWTFPLKLPRRTTTVYVVGFVVFLIVFAYVELTYTRRVDGTSMLPTLEEGDLVIIQNVPFSDLHVGDIIVYNPPCSATGSSVIHRIVNFSSGGAVTRGDNNGYTDIAGGIATGPITANCYVGKVVLVVPYIERIASLPYGTNYIIAALILAAVIYLWLGESRSATEERAGAGPKPSTITEKLAVGFRPVLSNHREAFSLSEFGRWGFNLSFFSLGV